MKTLNTQSLEEMRQLRWKYASEAIEKYPAIHERLKHQESDANELRYREALKLYPEMPQSVKLKLKRHVQQETPETVREAKGLVCTSAELVIDRPRNWPGDDLIHHM